MCISDSLQEKKACGNIIYFLDFLGLRKYVSYGQKFKLNVNLISASRILATKLENSVLLL